MDRKNHGIIVDRADNFLPGNFVVFLLNGDPGIVLGRFLKDELIPYTDISLSRKLRHTYNFRS